MDYDIAEVRRALDRYRDSFEKVLYARDPHFEQDMDRRGLTGPVREQYRHWDWVQGVGLFGIWKRYAATGDERCLDILTRYYQRQLTIGLPPKNVNTVTPLLALSFLGETQQNERYLALCDEWARWIMTDFPRTRLGGLQHLTMDSANTDELWDDTLFMTVLFLANMGRIRHRSDWLEEAEYQFLLHLQYLADRHTGLWYHGWTFGGNHNFAGAFWARGNCWLTAAIPEYLALVPVHGSVQRLLAGAWQRQVEALLACRAPDGLWHTLLDDDTSYEEASATCGFCYGILKGASLGLAQAGWADRALESLEAILRCTDEDGVLHQVSGGTAMGRDSKDFYKNIELCPMPYGQALAMLFLGEAVSYLS